MTRKRYDDGIIGDTIIALQSQIKIWLGTNYKYLEINYWL